MEVRESRHDDRFDDGSSGKVGDARACGNAYGGATIRSGVGGVGGRSGAGGLPPWNDIIELWLSEVNRSSEVKRPKTMET